MRRSLLAREKSLAQRAKAYAVHYADKRNWPDVGLNVEYSCNGVMPNGCRERNVVEFMEGLQWPAKDLGRRDVRALRLIGKEVFDWV